MLHEPPNHNSPLSPLLPRATRDATLSALLGAVRDPDQRQTVALRFLEGREPNEGLEQPRPDVDQVGHENETESDGSESGEHGLGSSNAMKFDDFGRRCSRTGSLAKRPSTKAGRLLIMKSPLGCTMSHPTITPPSPRATLDATLRALLGAVHDPDERQTFDIRFLEGRGPDEGLDTPPCRLKAWARVVARNLRRSASRSRLQLAGSEDDPAGRALEQLTARTTSAESLLALTRLVESARRVIAEWHPRGLALFELECQGLLTSGEELAEALGVSRCNVDKLRQRNRDALRRLAAGER